MSNEIRTAINLTVANGSYLPPTWVESGSFTQNAIDAAGGVMNCTTTFADISVGSVSTLGFMMAKNIDTTYNIELGLDIAAAFTGVLLLKPGESCLFRWKQGVTPAAKSITGSAKLQYWVLQD